MAHLRCDFRSDAMGMNTSMTVILPEKTDLSQVPVVYLLHGLSLIHISEPTRPY